ncbi:MAG: hypothetical protein V2B17_01710 [Chloroflexota bacterium]
MPGVRFFTAALAALLLVGCGASTPLTTPGPSAAATTAAPVTPTAVTTVAPAIPTATTESRATPSVAPTPTPAPTEVPGIRPNPGATLSGPIKMGHKATTAVITLQVSDDGSAITSMSFFFTDVKCEGFSASSIMTQDGSTHPISGGELRVDSSSLGKLTGEFTSPTAVAGSIELTINPGVGSPIPCGTWDWSASQE